MQTHRRMKRVLYLNTLNIHPLPRTKQHKTSAMKTKEMEKVASEKYDILGHNVESFFHWSDKDIWCDGYVTAMDEYASQFQQEWIPVEEETAREPIQDALYATGRFTKDECDVLSDGILRYINDANLVITPQPYNPTKS